MSSLAGNILGVIDPATYMGAYGDKASRLAAERQSKAGLKQRQEEFDLTKLLSMQDYREKERQRKWQADFMRYMSQGYSGGGA